MNASSDYLSAREYQFTNIIDLLRYRASDRPQVAYKFVRHGDSEIDKLTYQELDQQARKIAASLQSLNMTGERALLLYSPGLEFITAFFGCLYAGVIGVPAYPPRRNQNMSRLQSLVTEAQAKIALTTESLVSNIRNRFADNAEFYKLQWLITDSSDLETGQSWNMPEATANTLAFLQYTSGSTGSPKGVMITHGNLLHNERIIAQAFGHTKDTVVVGWLPLFHDMGLIGNVLQPLYLGQPCYLMSPLDFLQKPFRWLKAITHFKATTSGGPNFAYDLCLRKITSEQKACLDLSSWEVAFTGAEPIRASTLQQFAEAFKECGFKANAFYPCYGMAETTLFVTGGLKTSEPAIRELSAAALERNKVVGSNSGKETEKQVRQIVSCGQAWLDMEVTIADPKTGVRCDENRVGEIWVSGSSVANGYWNRPLETEQTFNAYLVDSKQGPYLRTGDSGFIKDNELYVTGRLKDVIIVRGQNYYPQDIEKTAEQSHAGLRPGCNAAFTLEIKGLERLIIVQEIERSYLRKLNIKEIVDGFRQAIAAEYGLQVYATVLIKPGSIPKTSSGKVQRYACRQQFLAGKLNIVKDWSENPRCKAEFLNLETDIDSILQRLIASK